MEKVSCVMWKARSHILQWSSVELSVKFLLNNGASIDDVKCLTSSSIGRNSWKVANITNNF